VIDRYLTPEMAELFSERSRIERWVAVELEVVNGWSGIGVVPHDAAQRIRDTRPVVDDQFIDAVTERETTTQHDVAAFVDVLTGHYGDDGRWIHLGLTSSDIVDTALGLCLSEAGTLLAGAAHELHQVLVDEARRHRSTVMMGRTHGVHAQPTTLGAKIALHAHQVLRAATRLDDAAEGVRVGKVSGPVGTYTNVDPRVEDAVCAALGLRAIPASQVVARDLHADLVYAAAAALTAVEALALQVRLGHQTEVAEIREGFGDGQKGSSAMPHKANPVVAEKLCGLARLGRAAIAPSLENVALWHERDISHSSVERVLLADICALTHYGLTTAGSLVTNWTVDVSRMADNVASTGDIVASESLLSALVGHGWARDDAYRQVQDLVGRALEGRSTLKDAVSEASIDLPRAVLDDVFDADRALSGAYRVVDDLV
jgi:adenylosuccinate lyase